MLQIQDRAAENGASCATNCFSPIVNPFNSAVHEDPSRHAVLLPTCDVIEQVVWALKGDS